MTGRARPGPKFQFLFRAGPGRARTEISVSLMGRAGPGSDLFFNFSYGPGRTRAETFSLLRAGPGLKNPARADL